MQRGSDKHSPRKDDALQAELSGQLGEAGGHREEWRDPEPPADDDPILTRRPDQGDGAPASLTEVRDEPTDIAAPESTVTPE
jgi:hypothetical protein